MYEGSLIRIENVSGLSVGMKTLKQTFGFNPLETTSGVHINDTHKIEKDSHHSSWQ